MDPLLTPPVKAEVIDTPQRNAPLKSTAGEKATTAHEVLYPLSYRRLLSERDSNPRPPALEAKYP